MSSVGFKRRQIALDPHEIGLEPDLTNTTSRQPCDGSAAQWWKGETMVTIVDPSRPSKDEAFALTALSIESGNPLAGSMVKFLLDSGATPSEIGQWAHRRGIPWENFDAATEAVFGARPDDHLKALEAFNGEAPLAPPAPAVVPTADSEDYGDSERTLDGWTPPIPLGYSQNLPTFPVEALPLWLGDYVQAVARFTQTPTDLAAMVALAVTSAVVAKRFQVRVRGHWTEPLNIYVVVALRSGERKSPVMRLLVAPVERLEAEMRAAAAPVIREAQTRKKAAEALANAAQKAADDALPEKREELLEAAVEMRRLADEIVVRPRPRLIADDITQEALATMLEEQDGRVAILSEEGGFIEILAGRYSEGRPNIDTFLKGHSGDPIRVDRKGRPAERIESPAITVGITVQPDVVQGLARVKGFRGRGLVARILFNLPTSRVGTREIEPDLIPESLKLQYEANVLAMGMTRSLWTHNAVTLTLDDSACQKLIQFQRDIEPQLAPGARLGHIADWGGKLVGAAVRIAGILHIIECAGQEVPLRISTETIERAIAIAEYLVPHALMAFDLMGTDLVIDDAKRVLVWVRDGHFESFTARDCFQALRGTFKKMTRLNEALGLLVGHHYLHEPARSKKTGPGRPSSPTFWVNPWIHA